MHKVKPTTKEQLTYYLLMNISLGTYDKRFLNNLQSYFPVKKPITTNQAELLDKITLRYFKQLKRKEIDANEMVKLPWGLEPIDSIPEYTDAFCTINDDVIEIRTPYKKDFITELKGIDLQLDWNRETKTWCIIFCEYTLKHVIDCLDKHFQVIRYCDKTVDIISNFADYEEATCWDPTLKLVNGNLLIAGINSSVNEATKHIPLTLSAETFAKLAMYGVVIDTNLVEHINDEQLAKFAIEHNTVYSYKDIPILIENLVKIGCDFILVSETRLSSNDWITQLGELCEESKIPYKVKRRAENVKIDFKQYACPVIINTGMWSSMSIIPCTAKIINLANSNPVNIK